MQNTSLGPAENPICIVAPYLPVVSETFIRGHAERLQGSAVFVHSWPPSIGDRPVLRLPTRMAYKITRRLLGPGTRNETTAAYMAAFRRAAARVVMAEYGTIGVATMEACRVLDIPLIVHFHGYDASVRDVLDEHKETYPLMFQQAAAIIAVSRSMERKLISLGAPPEKVHYNPCGINCNEFRGADPANSPPLFVAVGRFVDKKAPQATLRAFAKVHRKMPEAHLRMIGDGPLFEECRTLATQLNIANAVTFLGSQSSEVVQDELRAARCFVQHSVEASNGDCEGTPLGILEAGGSGLPVVSTRHAGISDVVIEGETGLLVDEWDIDGMAEQMLRIAQDPDLAARLGRAGRLRIESNFSEQRSFDRLRSIIDGCLEKSEEPA